MKRLIILLLVVFSPTVAPSSSSWGAEPFCAPPDRVDWSTMPAKYTHDRSSGRRVDQYAQAVEPIAPPSGNYQRSGYRQSRSSLQVGYSADNMHIVEQWGNPVQPYDEWRFPNRPYSAPYNQWGPPLQVYGNLNPFPIGPFGFGGGPVGFGPGNMPPQGNPGGPNGMPNNGNMPPNNLPPNMGQPPGGGFPPGYIPPGYYQNQNSYPGFHGPQQPWNAYGTGPWIDGYYNAAPHTPRMPDREFYYNPSGPNLRP